MFSEHKQNDEALHSLDLDLPKICFFETWKVFYSQESAEKFGVDSRGVQASIAKKV